MVATAGLTAAVSVASAPRNDASDQGQLVTRLPNANRSWARAREVAQNCPNGFLCRRWKASEVVLRNAEWLATFGTSHGVGNFLEWGTVFAL